jgi:hypothetical protein
MSEVWLAHDRDLDAQSADVDRTDPENPRDMG